MRPLDPQRLNAADSVYLTRPSRPHFIRTRDEFAWRTGELFDAIAAETITVTVSAHYPLKDAAQAHRDLQARKTIGSVVLTPNADQARQSHHRGRDVVFGHNDSDRFPRNNRIA